MVSNIFVITFAWLAAGYLIFMHDAGLDDIYGFIVLTEPQQFRTAAAFDIITGSLAAIWGMIAVFVNWHDDVEKK